MLDVRTPGECGSNFGHQLGRMGSFVSNNASNSTGLLAISNNVPMLNGIVLGFALIGPLILLVQLDPPARGERMPSLHRLPDLMSTTIDQMTSNLNQMLIIPLTIWTGLEHIFWSVDFAQVNSSIQSSSQTVSTGMILVLLSQAFIACSTGMNYIRYIIITFGLIFAISGALYGYLVQLIGRLPFFLSAAGVSLLILLSMQFFWSPDAASPAILFVIAALWGCTEAVWSTFLHGRYGHHHRISRSFS